MVGSVNLHDTQPDYTTQHITSPHITTLHCTTQHHTSLHQTTQHSISQGKPMERPSFAQSYETQQIVKLLQSSEHPDFFGYEEIGKASGIADKQKLGAAIRSARRILQRENGVVFETVPGEGVKRATDDEIVGSAARDVSCIRRKSRRAVDRLSKVKDFSALSRDKKSEFNVATSSLALIHHITTPSAQRKIENGVERQSTKLPVADTLAALGVK